MNPIRGTRILITGGAGFLGSFITEQLLQAGAEEIVVVDNLIRGSEEHLRNALATRRIRFIKGDIRDQNLLNEALQNKDYCLHLAALRITHCAADPQGCLEVMYQGTLNVLRACASAGVRRVIFASSASIYGQADSFPTEESHHPYNNFTLYGAAKMAGELMCRSFYEMHGLDFVALRYFNIYGPRTDTQGKYTEVLIRWYDSIEDGQAPVIYGTGEQTMDFIYVQDAARASVLALMSEFTNEVFNIASGRETSLKDLCATLLEVMGSDLEPKYIPVPDARQKVEVLRRWANVSRARQKLGFQAQVDLKEGLKSLVQWLHQQRREVVSR